MKLSDYVIDFLVREKVHHIFEMIGGAITHLLDSTHGRRDITCVSMHHEQAASFAAEAYARMNGRLGVAMATSGPGALNMMTPIGSCYFDSVPCLFITGQVNTYEYKFSRKVRQIGFQETDIVSVAKPLVKYAELIKDAADIRYCLEKAVFLAQSGRPGPVLLDIPMNVQRAQIAPEKLRRFLGSAEHRILSAGQTAPASAIARTIKLIKDARRPVILAGGGLRTAGATGELAILVKATGIPVVCSLMGLDALPHDEPAFAGMIGSYGNRYSNITLANCDLVLILGSRLDTRQTGTSPDTFARGAKKVHVDVDPLELGSKVKTDLAVRAQLKDFLARLNEGLKDFRKNDLSAWYGAIAGYRRSFPEVETKEKRGEINPNRLMQLLSKHSLPGDIICVDVGQNQMWAAQSLRLKPEQRLLTSGGMGSMGFSLPAAIGASLACPGRRVLAVCGDGGLQVNIQELDSLPSRRLPIKLILMNNGCLGMVRQFQDLYFGGRRQSTLEGYNCPDLKNIIAAYGITGRTVSDPAKAEKTLRAVLASKGPALLEVSLPLCTAVEPKLVVNRPIEDMSPHMTRKKLHKAMLVKPLKETDVLKRVLITGASGFVGRNAAEYLAASGKYEVFACKDGDADLRDLAAVRKAVAGFAPDIIVNCAAAVTTRKTGYDKPAADVIGPNLSIFFNLLNAKPAGARLVQLGSGAEYDRRAYKPRMPEEYFDASVPADAYGFSKYVASKYAAADSSVTVLRIFGLYGRYEDYTFKFVSNAIVKSLLGLPIAINQNCVFDFLPVADFCRLLEAVIAAKPAHGQYNACSGERIDLLGLAGLVNAAASVPVEVQVLNPGLGLEYSGLGGRFAADFPDFRFTPHAEAIKELYAYYRERLGELDLAAVKADPYLKNCRTDK